MSNDDKYEIYLQFNDNLDDECNIPDLIFHKQTQSCLFFNPYLTIHQMDTNRTHILNWVWLGGTNIFQIYLVIINGTAGKVIQTYDYFRIDIKCILLKPH